MITNSPELGIRKIVEQVETTYIEGGKAAGQPLKLIGIAAVLDNPWAGRGFVDDLKADIARIAPTLGEILSAKIIEHAGSGDVVEGYGKAAIVGLNGEIEHCAGIIHTLRFGNTYRQAVDAKSYLSFTNIRGGANTPIMIPLMDKNDAGKRSHYLTIHMNIPDAPNENEMLIALGASVGGRPHHRIGDRYQDIEDMGGDIDNPAGV